MENTTNGLNNIPEKQLQTLNRLISYDERDTLSNPIDPTTDVYFTDESKRAVNMIYNSSINNDSVYSEVDIDFRQDSVPPIPPRQNFIPPIPPSRLNKGNNARNNPDVSVQTFNKPPCFVEVSEYEVYDNAISMPKSNDLALALRNDFASQKTKEEKSWCLRLKKATTITAIILYIIIIIFVVLFLSLIIYGIYSFLDEADVLKNDDHGHHETNDQHPKVTKLESK